MFRKNQKQNEQKRYGAFVEMVFRDGEYVAVYKEQHASRRVRSEAPVTAQAAGAVEIEQKQHDGISFVERCRISISEIKQVFEGVSECFSRKLESGAQGINRLLRSSGRRRKGCSCLWLKNSIAMAVTLLFFVFGLRSGTMPVNPGNVEKSVVRIGVEKDKATKAQVFHPTPIRPAPVFKGGPFKSAPSQKEKAAGLRGSQAGSSLAAKKANRAQGLFMPGSSVSGAESYRSKTHSPTSSPRLVQRRMPRELLPAPLAFAKDAEPGLPPELMMLERELDRKADEQLRRFEEELAREVGQLPLR